MSDRLLPMSPAQQGMYFDCQLRQPVDYHIVLDLELEPVDRQALAHAVDVVIAEQPALRTAVVESSEGPAYTVFSDVAAPFAWYDAVEDADSVDSLFTRHSHAPFQLDRAPLFRVVAARVTDAVRLLIICHHLIADGESVSMLATRLLELSHGDASGELDPEPGMAVYQEGQALSPTFEAHARREAFWTENIARHEAPQLGHWLRDPVPEDIGREHRLPVPSELAKAVRRVAREAGVSEFTVYLAAFGVLLSRYSGGEQVSFGSPFSDRPHIEMETSIGCFIRTLPVRIDAGVQSVADLLAATRAEVISLWRNLDFPSPGCWPANRVWAEARRYLGPDVLAKSQTTNTEQEVTNQPILQALTVHHTSGLDLLAYVFAVRLGCLLVGIPVPENPMQPGDMFVGFVQLLWREVGMLAICLGWFGFFLPLMHKWTRSHVWSGIATGGGIALFVAPGNAFSSFNLAIAWPLYATQLIILSITMSLLLSRMKGNVLFFLIPFWVSASGSLWRLYHFAAPTQLIQITLLVVLALTLYFVLKRSGLPDMHTFPEYLESDYASRSGAVLAGKGNRSRETSFRSGQRLGGVA